MTPTPAVAGAEVASVAEVDSMAVPCAAAPCMPDGSAADVLAPAGFMAVAMQEQDAFGPRIQSPGARSQAVQAMVAVTIAPVGALAQPQSAPPQHTAHMVRTADITGTTTATTTNTASTSAHSISPSTDPDVT